MKKNILLFIGLLILGSSFAQSEHSLLRDGNTSYENEDYANAEENYRRALEKKNSGKATYNLGNSIYKQDRVDEAVIEYEKAVEKATNANLKSKAYHNLGNAHFKMQDYQNSVDAYKNALRLNPKDYETKYNLAQAQRQLRIQQQQQQQQQNQEQQEQNQDQQQAQNQDPDQDQQQQQNQGQQQQAAPEPQEEESNNAPPQEVAQDLSRKEAEELLRIAEEEEQKVQGKLRKGDNKKSKSKKDW
ncbi:MAG: tetratricopeptide repeat protein [Bacteroidota bacterium]